MLTPRAQHKRISSVPNLLLNQERLFPRGNQYITQAAIIESGTVLVTRNTYDHILEK